jgi:hypothetical protein
MGLPLQSMAENIFSITSKKLVGNEFEEDKDRELICFHINLY